MPGFYAAGCVGVLVSPCDYAVCSHRREQDRCACTTGLVSTLAESLAASVTLGSLLKLWTAVSLFGK